MSGIADFDDLLDRLLETRGSSLPSRGAYERAFAELLDGASYTPQTSHDIEYLGWQLELKRTRSRHYWINCLRLAGELAGNNAYVFIKTVGDAIADVRIVRARDMANVILDGGLKDMLPNFKRSENVLDWNLQARVQHSRICALATHFARVERAE